MILIVMQNKYIQTTKCDLDDAFAVDIFLNAMECLQEIVVVVVSCQKLEYKGR